MDTRRGQPATLTVGDGNLLPGFEAVLIGLQEGDDAQITIPAVDAFGERNPANVQTMPKDRFAGCCGTGARAGAYDFLSKRRTRIAWGGHASIFRSRCGGL